MFSLCIMNVAYANSQAIAQLFQCTFDFTKGIHLVIVCLVQGEYISLVVVHSVLVGIGQAYGERKWLQSVLIDR